MRQKCSTKEERETGATKDVVDHHLKSFGEGDLKGILSDYAPGAIPWLLLPVVGAQDMTDNDMLTAATFIQRLNNAGGVAPSTGCASLKDVGNEAFVPYTADYFFYSDLLRL